ncbi:hypothetical protein [Streptosporangium canum]|uniref:hypothetical protein n=1 Tax=Streptosporangium canum TaxID=324952 RepID=UPI0037B83B4E
MDKLPRHHLRRMVARAAILRDAANRDAADLAAVSFWHLRRRRALTQQARDSAIIADAVRYFLIIALGADCFDQEPVEADVDRMINDYILWDRMQGAGTYLLLGLDR